MPLLLQIHTPPQSSSPVFLHPSIALFPLHFILLSLHLLRIPPHSILSPSDSYHHSIASESSLFISHITLHGGISRPLAPPTTLTPSSSQRFPACLAPTCACWRKWQRSLPVRIGRSFADPYNFISGSTLTPWPINCDGGKPPLAAGRPQWLIHCLVHRLRPAAEAETAAATRPASAHPSFGRNS